MEEHPPIESLDLDTFSAPESLLLSIPPSLVREMCIIPIHVTPVSMTVAHPNDGSFGEFERRQLDFVLNLQFHWIPTPRATLETAIDRLYDAPFAGVINCKSNTPTHCPHRWRSFCDTNERLTRFCSSCNKLVHLAEIRSQVQQLIDDGRTVAIVDYPPDDPCDFCFH